MIKTLVFTVVTKIEVAMEDFDAVTEVLEAGRNYGEAEITDVKIKEGKK